MRHMQKTLLCCLLAGSSSALLADDPSMKNAVPSFKKEVPYDEDLFNKDKTVVFASGEFLYWLVNEGALEYAIKMNKPAWNSEKDTAAIGKYQNAVFHWSPGLRLNVGYFNAPHYWDAIIQYTYLPSSGHTEVKAPSSSDEYLNGTWIQPDMNTGTTTTPPLPAPLRKATSHVELNYNVFDFLFSRRFHLNEHLRVNLFGGLTAASLHQHLKVHYEDINELTSKIRNRWRFDGLGLRAGFKMDWYMGWDLYLTGLASGGIVSGWYKNTAHQKTSLSPIPVRHSNYEDHRLSATAQVMLGPSWQKRFNAVRTELVAGYEFTVWNNLQEVYRSSYALPTAAKEPFVNSSMLSLQGLTVRLTVDF